MTAGTDMERINYDTVTLSMYRKRTGKTTGAGKIKHGTGAEIRREGDSTEKE